MNLTPYVDSLRQEFLAAAEAAGEETLQIAERLVPALDSAVRLTLLHALSTAADEISRELAPGSVEVRLRGLDPGFAVTRPSPDPGYAPVDDGGAEQLIGDGDGATARINFRPPEHLKERIEEAAGREGLSVNAWLVRAVAATLSSGAKHGERKAPSGTRHWNGWVR
ncbi:hypothetical protein [Streptomyces jumonjinensis]|uniref:hypothetical protein n=1 Tax=Streptomyces jumonjinensis TaxID=1945 RepID=UPI0037AA5D97